MKYARYGAAILLTGFLFMVRYFQHDLFYDPLLTYFDGDFNQTQFPDIDKIKHLGSIVLRYGINSVISLGIIHLLFMDMRITRLSAFIYGGLLLLLLPLYFYFIETEFSNFFTAGFYVRRLLIQPLMLLVLVPAIWYYKKKTEDVRFKT